MRSVPRKAKPKASRAKGSERSHSPITTVLARPIPTFPSSVSTIREKRASRPITIKHPSTRRRNAFADSDFEDDEFRGDPSEDDIDDDEDEERASDMEFEAMVAEDDIKVKEEMRKRSTGNRRGRSVDSMEATGMHIPLPPVPSGMVHHQVLPYPQHPFPSQQHPHSIPTTMSIPIPGAQQNPPTETTYASLPKSLQEAFLILDNLTPTPGTGEGLLPDAEMIDPALMPSSHGIDPSHLPPLPPMPASTLSPAKQAVTSNSLTNLASAAVGHEPSSHLHHHQQQQHQSQQRGGGGMIGSPQQQQHGFIAPQQPSQQPQQQPHPNFPQPFYYQPAPGTHFLQSETAALSLPGHFRLSTPSFP